MGRPNILYTAFVAQNYMSATTAKMGTDVKKLATTTSIASAQMAASLSKVSSAAMGIGFAGIAIATGIIIPLGLATKAAVNFQAQMANVSTLVDTTAENMDAMGESVLRLSKKIPKPLSDLTEGLYFVRSAGIGAAEAMGVLEASGNLAVSGLSTTTEAAKAVTSAMVSFKAQGLSAQQIANSFFLTVQEGKTKMADINESFGATAIVVASAGMKLQEFNAATAALTNTGMEASLAQLAIKNTVIGLMRPTAEMARVFKSLNVTTGEQLIAMYGYAGAIEKVAEKTKTLNLEQAKLFNRTALPAFIGLTGVAHDQLIKNTKQQMEAQDALSGATAKQMATAAAKVKLFTNRVQILGISIGNILIPPLTKMVSIISPIVDGIVSFSHHHKILASVIVDSVAVIGLFAGTIGVASLAISGLARVTKGLIIINGLFGDSELVAAGKTGVLTAAINTEAAAATRATEATAAMNTVLKAGIVTAARLAATLAVIYVAYKQVAFWQDRSAKKQSENPLGFDYGNINKPADANSDKNKVIRDKFGISEDQFNKQRDYYNYQENGNRKKGVKKKHFKNGILGIFGVGNSDTDQPSGAVGGSGGINADDSLLINQQQELNKRRDSDSLYNKPTSANYVPKNGMQNITITIDNKTGLAANVSTNSSGNSATAVPIKVKSTTSRKNDTA